ncbi:MAG: hypothetical protein ACI4ED_06505 [Suilimivivens sp.]
MPRFYKLLNQKMESTPAMFCFLLINIVFWFLVGGLAGALLAFFFLGKELMLSCAVTLGACLALTLGYVYGYIVVIRNS